MAYLETPPSPEQVKLGQEDHMRPPQFERTFFIGHDLSGPSLKTIDVNERSHHYITAEVDGFTHSGWYTPPSAEDSGIIIVTKPGWGEIVDSGIGWEQHRRLAKALPEVAVFTHETDGIGNYARRKSVSELFDHGIDQMALQGLELLKRVSHDKQVVAVGTSMGSVIFNRLLLRNIEQNQPVDVAGVVYNAPALVDPSRVVKDMGIRFFPELFSDVGLELLRTQPRYLGNLILSLVQSRPAAANMLPLSKQGLDLLRGTPDQQIEAVIAQYPIDVVVGDRDPVGQAKRWQERAHEHQGVSVHLLKGRGHGIAIKPYEYARKISRIIREKYL